MHSIRRRAVRRSFPRIVSMIALLTAPALAFPGPASAEILTFTDRPAWENVLGQPDFVETFDEFTEDTPFRSNPVDLEGFSIVGVPPRENLFAHHNTIQVAPFPGESILAFSSPHVWLYPEADSGLHVEMSFIAPIVAWGADLAGTGPGGGEVLQIRITFEDASEMTIDLPGYPEEVSGFFGLLANAGERIDRISFVTVPDGNFALGQHFLMDDASGLFEFATAACNNGLDEDGDTLIDYPADPGCVDPLDVSESSTEECDNGVDDDGDAMVDHVADPGCGSPTDESELSAIQCDNGLDDDDDGTIDWRGDPTGDRDCYGLTDVSEMPSPPPGCGFGAELMLLAPLLWLRRRRA
jgi:hypothetical protein